MDKFTVRNVDGSVDVAASTALYVETLSHWLSQHEVSNDAIDAAINTAFDEHGSTIPTDAMVGFVVAKVNPNPSAFTLLSKRVRTYLKSQREAGKLHLAHGANGGLVRSSVT